MGTSVIIRLQNLPLTANSIDIRTFFNGLSIPDGGVHIVGGRDGDAFIAFSSDEDARQAMGLSGTNLQDSTVRLLLSSRSEMFKVIEQARQKTLGISPSPNNVLNAGAPAATPNTSGSSREPTIPSQSPFQTPHVMQTSNPGSNPSLLSGHGNLPNSTNAFGIPNMSTFAGIMNLPQGMISQQQSPFGAMNNVGQLPSQSQMNSILGHPQGGSGIFTQPPSQAQQQQPPRSGQTQQQQFNHLMSPFGTSISAQIASNTQFPIPNNNNPLSIGGQQQQQQQQGGHPQGHGGLNPQQMHMQMGNNGSSLGLGLGNHMMSGIQNPPPNPFQTGNDRMGMGMMGNSPMGTPNSINPFMNPPPAFGTHSTAGGDSMSGGQSVNPFGIDLSSIGGRGRLSRFQVMPPTNIPDLDESNGHGPMGRGRSDPNSRDGSGRGKPPGFGGFGRGDTSITNNRDRDLQFGNNRERGERSIRRTRSRSRERRDQRHPAGGRGERERSRDRDNRRRRRTKSKSRSRSRDRSTRSGRRNSSLESRDKLASPDKNKHDGDDTSGNDDVLIINEGAEEEFPCVKLAGLPKDSSFREVKEFLRVDIRGGTDGIVRSFEDGVAFIRLENSSDFPRVYRRNGSKINSSTIRIEGIRLDVWDAAYNAIKRQPNPEREVEKGPERERNRLIRDNDRERERDRGDRDTREDREHRPRDHDRSTIRTTGLDCCVVVKGLPGSFSIKDIKERILCGVKKWAYSEIVIENEKSRGIINAYIQVVSTQEAQRIIESISKLEDAPPYRPQIFGMDELWRVQKANSTSSTGGFKGKSSRFSSAVPEAKSIFDLNIEMDSGSSSVILRGVPQNLTERDMVDFFSDIGSTPLSVRILYDNSGNPSGEVICEFQDAQRARRATTKDGVTIGRSTISVQLLPAGNGIGSELGQNGPSSGGYRGGPRGSGGILGRPPRFPSNSPNRTANPFVQAAMQQGMRGPPPPRGGGGPRGRGSGFFGGRGGFRGGMRPPFGSSNGEWNEASGGNDPHLMVASNFRIESLFERKGCVVAITNIPYSASMEEFLKFLNKTLQSDINKDRIIRRYNEFQQATGDARVAFDSPFEAQNAHDILQGAEMWNRKLEVSLPTEF